METIDALHMIKILVDIANAWIVSVRDYFVSERRSKMPRKVSRFHWELAEIIQKVSKIIDIHDIEYIIQYGCDDVDSFYNSTYLVHVNGKRNGQKIKKKIVIKCHLDLIQRACFRELYRRDNVFHKIVVPKLLDIQRTFNVIEGLKIKFPNCLYSSIEHDKEVIVFSQCSANGQIHNRNLKVNLDHAILALKNLAKLHALSFVWETIYPDEFNEVKSILRKDVQYSDVDEIPKSMKYYYDASVDVVTDPSYKAQLKQLAPKLLTVLKSATLPAGYSTVCHGDCWSNNTFFKHQGTRPVAVMFADYQLSRYASPVTDISYFLYMSTDRDLLFQHYATLINAYYGTLSAVLRQCNLKPKEIYPLEIFKQQLKEYSVIGLVEALVSMKIITADTDDAIKMTEMKYNQPDICIDDYESKNQTLFIERVNGIVDSFFNCNYTLSAVLNLNSECNSRK